MQNKISCRESVYGGYEKAVDYLPRAGIRYIEIQQRPPEKLRKVAEYCTAKGVIPLTVSGELNCDDLASVEKVKAVCAAMSRFGIGHYFLSTKGTDRAAGMACLRALGNTANGAGATLCLETHPPFCMNAEEMRKTMNEVNHPNVRINFDTANIFYYNQAMESADELEKIVRYVATVHLKDTDGGFKSMKFPVFGKGVVQFPRIFKTLHAANFCGPLTIELEGPLMKGLDADGIHERVAGCMEYLKSIGEV
jgi:sugar phosphate isomerase/epimerase